MLCLSLLWARVPGDQYVPFPSLLLPYTQPLNEHPRTAVSLCLKEKVCLEVVFKSGSSVQVSSLTCGQLSSIPGPSPYLPAAFAVSSLPPLPPQVSLLLPGRDPGRAVCSRWTSPAPLPSKRMDQANELATQHHVPVLWCLGNRGHAHLSLLQHCAPGLRQSGFGYGRIH